ncbi:hypothetical protein KR038_005555 [Drosophila bunnanda]|nr:hypothetical protein KR038_005555 [Drosophila bunnanda]
MIGLQKKRPAPGKNIVPNNSVLNITPKTGPYNPTPNAMEQSSKGGAEGKCRYCENMAKNFLYLESLIRNNSDKGEKCSLCNSSLKYLEYVNRNIRQVFGNFDAIFKADRALASKPATLPKYSVASLPEKVDMRAKGGAVVSAQKSLKNLKSKAPSLKAKSKSKSVDKLKRFKGQKSLKSLRSLKTSKSAKSTRSTKSTKSVHMSRPVKDQRSPLKLAKSGSKGLRKGLAKSKSQISHGKMVLKSKFRNKAPSKVGSNKMTRSVSHYRSLAASRSKVSKGHSHTKLVKQRSEPIPTSINWRLLKQNLPKRKPTLGRI